MGASPHRPESALRHWAFASPGVVILYFTAVQFSSPGQLREQFHYTVPLPQREFANNASREVGERGFILVNPNFVKPVLNTAHCRRDTLPHPEGVLEGGQLCDAGQASSMMLMARGGGAGPREGAGARRWLLSCVGSMQRETMTVMSSFYSRPAGRRPSKCRCPRRPRMAKGESILLSRKSHQLSWTKSLSKKWVQTQKKGINSGVARKLHVKCSTPCEAGAINAS
eukprot:scaffold74070_cov67-Phaeocystis_antarctica.AAC.6